MVGGIKASSPGMKSMSADMFLDLPTMSAPSGEERKLRASAQVERAGLCLRRFSGAQPGVPSTQCRTQKIHTQYTDSTVWGICATKSPQKQKVAAPSCASTPPPPHHTHMVQADTGTKFARRRALPCPGRPAWHRWALAPRPNACRNRVEAVLRQGLAQVHFWLKFYWC
jgi:hypothetical protein